MENQGTTELSLYDRPLEEWVIALAEAVNSFRWTLSNSFADDARDAMADELNQAIIDNVLGRGQGPMISVGFRWRSNLKEDVSE